MSDARGIHFEAAGFAGLAVEQLQQAIAGAKDHAESAILAVSNAVGATDQTSGQNALSYTAHVRDELESLIGTCESIKGELERYGRGF